MTWSYRNNEVMQERAMWRKKRTRQRRNFRNVLRTFPVAGAGALALYLILAKCHIWSYGLFHTFFAISIVVFAIVAGMNDRYSSAPASTLSFTSGMLFSLSISCPPEDIYESVLFALSIVHAVPFLALLTTNIIIYNKPGLNWARRTRRVLRRCATATGVVLLAAAAPLLITSFMYALSFALIVVFAAVNAYSVSQRAKKLKSSYTKDWALRQFDLIPSAIERASAKYWTKVSVAMLGLWIVSAFGRYETVFRGWSLSFHATTLLLSTLTD